MRRFDNVLGEAFGTDGEDFAGAARRGAGGGLFTAYGSVIDEVSQDLTLVVVAGN